MISALNPDRRLDPDTWSPVNTGFSFKFIFVAHEFRESGLGCISSAAAFACSMIRWPDSDGTSAHLSIGIWGRYLSGM
jgi:hypothetical protein